MHRSWHRFAALLGSYLSLIRNLSAAAQVRDEFFDLIDRIVTKLYERSIDPSDSTVHTFWQSFAEIPAANIYNMDEVGCDSNKARVTKVMRDDQLFHNFEDTDGDHTPFHVTNALTTCANGTTPIPPFLIHSNPTSKAHGLPKVTKRCVPNITPQ